MWKLNNSELETNTYERKHGLSLFKLTNNRFPLITLNNVRVQNPINNPILVVPERPILVDTTTPLVPVSTSKFYFIQNLTLSYNFLTEVSDSDLITTNNSYYVNYGNINPYTLIHSNLDSNLILNTSYTFTFIVPERNNNFEYIIDLTNFTYLPSSISYIMASGIRFNSLAASEGCPNYFSFDPNAKRLTLKGCSSCKPVTGDVATVYANKDMRLDSNITTYICYKFNFSSDISLVTSLFYNGKNYTLNSDIQDGTLLYSSELNSCLCLSRS